MAKYDLLLTPTMPMTAFAVNENAAWGGDGVDIGWTPFTLTFNLTRQPAATIPCGLDREGLPIGLQIVGGPRPRRAGAARGRRLRARAPDPGAADGASDLTGARASGPLMRRWQNPKAGIREVIFLTLIPPKRSSSSLSGWLIAYRDKPSNGSACKNMSCSI